MKLYAAIYTDTDGYTYTAEWVLDIYTTFEEAYRRVEAFCSDPNPYPHDLKDCDVKEFMVGEDWN